LVLQAIKKPSDSKIENEKKKRNLARERLGVSSTSGSKSGSRMEEKTGSSLCRMQERRVAGWLAYEREVFRRGGAFEMQKNTTKI